MMKQQWRLAGVALFILCGAVLAVAVKSAMAQSAAGNMPVELWVDTRTHQVFTQTGPHRVRLNIPGTISPDELNRDIEAKVQEKTESIQSQLSRQEAVNASLAKQNSDLTKQVTAMKPDWKSYAYGFAKNLYIGTVLYADYAFYAHTAFGPAFIQNLNQPGQGNNAYNSFDITRAYLNFLFTPTKDWLFRLTPDVYRTIGATNDKFGQSGAIGSTLDGNLGINLKYAYVQYKNFLDGSNHLKGAFINFGEMPNPFIPWEEDMTGYRFVYYVPWNYLGLPSAQTGISMGLPFKTGEETYIDSEFGAFTNATYRQLEQTDTKPVMARLSAYPFGALWRFDGLGITGFYDYGYGNTTPDQSSIPAALKGPNARITRVAALIHYTAAEWQIAGEFDWGHNAFMTGNLWSGSGPGDAFGFPTCQPTQNAPNTCTNPKTPPGLGTPGFADTTTLAQALLNNGRSNQQGFDFFGHYHIPTTPLTVFGIFQWFLPNTKVSRNPFDFQRWVVGISYQYNEYLRFAIDSQNLNFYHSQFNFPTAEALQFNTAAKYTPLSKNFIADVVPRDIHAFYLNVEFDY